MRTLIVLVLCVFTHLSAQGVAQQKSLDENIHGQIGYKAESIFSSLVELRRDIHQHPELSGQEERTSGLISDYLRKLGLEVKTNVGGFGVVGILRGGKPGPVIAWRADMDALADNSTDGVDFKSVHPGVKHACGHDVHVTIGLGIANVLSSVKDKLLGTVLFIFQPAEENFTGAKAMLGAGLFDKMKPEAVFALHLGSIPTGTATTKPKEMFARRARINVELKNITNEEEALHVCASLLKELNTPAGIDIFSVPLGDSDKGIFNPQGVLTDYFALGGAPRIERQGDSTYKVEARVFSSSEFNLKSATESLKKAVSNSQLKDKLLRLTHSYLQPVVTNDPWLTAKSMEILQPIYGNKSIVPLHGVIPGFNDDFAFYQESIKGVYFFLGASDFEKGIVSMPHAPNFAVDEKCIKKGVTYFSSLLFEWTRQ